MGNPDSWDSSLEQPCRACIPDRDLLLERRLLVHVDERYQCWLRIGLVKGPTYYMSRASHTVEEVPHPSFPRYLSTSISPIVIG